MQLGMKLCNNSFCRNTVVAILPAILIFVFYNKSEGQDAVKESYRTLWQWSEPIDDHKYLNNPHCIVLDSDGNIWIADMGASRILQFSPKGDFLSELGKGKGEEEGYFNKPRDVVIDPKGDFYVSDQKSKKHRIQIFSSEGEFLRSFASEGKGPGQIDWPHGLDLDNELNVYVTDVANQRVNKYNNSGKFIMSLGMKGPNAGKLKMPHGLTVTPDNAVFISDYFGTVQKFTPEGEYITSFTPKVHKKGSAFIHTIASDKLGNVYVMVRGIKGFEGTYEESKAKDRAFYIVKYNNDGEFICTIKLSDKRREIIHSAIDSEGRIYALFIVNGRQGVEVLGRD